MNELYERLLIGAEQIGSVVPALVGAAVIMLTGYFLARQVQRWADDTLKKVEASGVEEVILYFNVGCKPHNMVQEQMHRFMEQIAPHFQGKHNERRLQVKAKAAE